MQAAKNVHLLLAVMAATSFAGLHLASAEDPQKSNWLRSDLYDQGCQAYERYNWVVALEDLYAFREANKDRLKASAFQNTLDNAIENCEARLNDALQGLHVTAHQHNHHE